MERAQTCTFRIPYASLACRHAVAHPVWREAFRSAVLWFQNVCPYEIMNWATVGDDVMRLVILELDTSANSQSRFRLVLMIRAVLLVQYLQGIDFRAVRTKALARLVCTSIHLTNWKYSSRMCNQHSKRTFKISINIWPDLGKMKMRIRKNATAWNVRYLYIG